MNKNKTAKKIHNGRTKKRHARNKHTSKKNTRKKHDDMKKNKKKKFIVGIVSVPLTPEKKYF